MLNDLTILAQASAMARHAAERHRIIARNVANADTPGFKALDLPEFDASSIPTPQSAGARPPRFTALEIEGLETAPNGNNVGLEDQLVRSVDAQAQHQAALGLYRKAMDLLRLSITGRR